MLKLQGEIPEFVVLEIPDSAQQQMALSGDLFALGGFGDDSGRGTLDYSVGRLE